MPGKRRTETELIDAIGKVCALQIAAGSPVTIADYEKQRSSDDPSARTIKVRIGWAIAVRRAGGKAGLNRKAGKRKFTKKDVILALKRVFGDRITRGEVLTIALYEELRQDGDPFITQIQDHFKTWRRAIHEINGVAGIGGRNKLDERKAFIAYVETFPDRDTIPVVSDYIKVSKNTPFLPCQHWVHSHYSNLKTFAQKAYNYVDGLQQL